MLTSLHLGPSPPCAPGNTWLPGVQTGAPSGSTAFIAGPNLCLLQQAAVSLLGHVTLPEPEFPPQRKDPPQIKVLKGRLAPAPPPPTGPNPASLASFKKFPSFILRDAEEGAEGVRAQHGDEGNTPQTPNSMPPNTHTHIGLPPSPSRAPLTGAGWGAWGVRALGHTGERLTRLGLGPDASARDASS